MSAEEWRPIPGFPKYFISDCGRVMTTARGKPKIKSQHRDHKGYWLVGLNTPRAATVQVHTLVLEAFQGPRPEGHECRHLNGDKTDNRSVNLRWGTPIENARDRREHGGYKRAERCGRGHPASEENTYTYWDRRKSQYRRRCRPCQRITDRARQARKGVAA